MWDVGYAVGRIVSRQLRERFTSSLLFVFFETKIFKQFKELFLDFSNVRDYSYSEDCLSADRKFIKSLLVYGPNASGKSNLGYAIYE